MSTSTLYHIFNVPGVQYVSTEYYGKNQVFHGIVHPNKRRQQIATILTFKLAIKKGDSQFCQAIVALRALPRHIPVKLSKSNEGKEEKVEIRQL